MPLSLYDVTIPAFLRGFRNMAAHLDKAKVHAEANGLAIEELLTARLHPDMLPLIGQVQRASDTAKFVPARVAGLQAPSMPDTETSFDELKVRIAATADYLKTVPKDAFDGREEAEVVLKFGQQSFPFKARDYVTVFALPNFYFHVSTAYGILRHKGVKLGKVDFIGGL